jgi:CO dehydrogenase/acetyl-CoA synthase epsilon subunit
MTVKYEWVWELKYLKESDVEKTGDDGVAKAVSAAIEEARTQIARYQADPHFAGRTDVKYAVLVFIGKKRYVLKEIN